MISAGGQNHLNQPVNLPGVQLLMDPWAIVFFIFYMYLNSVM